MSSGVVRTGEVDQAGWGGDATLLSSARPTQVNPLAINPFPCVFGGGEAIPAHRPSHSSAHQQQDYTPPKPSASLSIPYR